jgi:hypothetical protein
VATRQTFVPFAAASLSFTIVASIKSNVDFCSTFRNRAMTVRTALPQAGCGDQRRSQK